MEMRHFKSLALLTEKHNLAEVQFKHYQQKINLFAPSAENEVFAGQGKHSAHIERSYKISKSITFTLPRNHLQIYHVEM